MQNPNEAVIAVLTQMALMLKAMKVKLYHEHSHKVQIEHKHQAQHMLLVETRHIFQQMILLGTFW